MNYPELLEEFKQLVILNENQDKMQFETALLSPNTKKSISYKPKKKSNPLPSLDETERRSLIEHINKLNESIADQGYMINDLEKQIAELTRSLSSSSQQSSMGVQVRKTTKADSKFSQQKNLYNQQPSEDYYKQRYEEVRMLYEEKLKECKIHRKSVKEVHIFKPMKN